MNLVLCVLKQAKIGKEKVLVLVCETAKELLFSWQVLEG